MATFPQVPLDLRVELSLAGTWTAATSKSYQRDGTQPPAVLARGRPDESARANPASATLELNNRDGRFSPKNPAGPYYGQLGRNAPVRLSVPAQASYLRLEQAQARAYVNNNASLSISGSIEMRIQLQLTDWQGGVLACKWDGGGCWIWALNADGTMTLIWVDSGTAQHRVTSSAPVPFTRGQFALRVTMDATTGTVAFSTAAAIDGTWSQLGAAASGTGGAATSILVASGSALAVGWSINVTPAQVLGRVAEFRLYNGINGTVAADGVFSAQAAGTAGWTDSAGNAWLLAGGGEISSRDYRFHGETSALPPKWDPSGQDISVPAAAAGVLRRLGQGQAPTRSPMRRAILSRTGTLAPVAYWPWEDGAASASLGSAIGGPAMIIDGSPKLASDSSFLASAPLPQLNGGRFQGAVPAYSGAGSIVCRFLMKLGTAPAATTTLLRLSTTGAVPVIDMQVTSAGLIQLASSGGAFSVGPLASPTGGGSWSGQQWWMSIELTPSGGNVNVAVVSLAPGASVAYGTTYASYAGAAGNCKSVRVNPYGGFADTVIGHLSVQASWETMFSLQQPLNAWAGERAGQRVARLCTENGLSSRITGPASVTAPMGPQSTATLITLLQECEDADRGMLHDARSQLAIGYRTYASLCQQAPGVTLDYAQAHLGGTGQAPEPTYDDQYIRNDMTVTRGSTGQSASQGATFQYALADGSPMSTGQPPGGAGDYANSLTVNVASDAQAADIAGWMVRVGTIDEARWPRIPLNLARTALSSLYYAILGLDAGDYVQVVNLPSWMTPDPVRQIAWGLTERLGGFHHEVELNCAPEAPYEVMLLDDPVFGHADTDGSALATGVSSSATTLTVASPGIQWTQAAGDLPFDLAVGGERVTVTAVGAPGGRQVNVADGTFESGVSGWFAQNGTVAQSGAQHHSGSFSALVTATSTAAVNLLPVALTPVIPGTTATISAWVMSTTAGEGFIPLINWFDASGNYISTSSGSTVTPGTLTWTNVALAVTVPAGVANAAHGVAMVPVASGNNCYADDVILQVTSQLLTVTRSVNGVVKAQAAGADVRLWHPPILAIR